MRSLAVFLISGSALLARADGLSVPLPTLPGAESATPSLLCGPADVERLVARRTDARFSATYNSVRGFVNGQLARLASDPAGLGDDTLSKVAKGAALLHFLGESPTASFATYRDAAVKALTSVGSRSLGNPVFPPADGIDPLQDSSRLQSLVEAYDLLRGTGVSASDDTTARARIASWAQALEGDLNLTGALGVPGHRDNWGVKAGAALVTCALGLPKHARAAGWRSFGMELINESLDKVASRTGWWRESGHYANYSLANLLTTAVEAGRVGGVDWVGPLTPLVQFALDHRQPDGTFAPFEEGVSAVFPFDLAAAIWPALGPQARWAWTHSPKDRGNFENQALHDATRFLLLDDASDEAEPTVPTRFTAGDTHAASLRSSWAADALVLQTITAVDHAATTTVTSRHNMQNPLDLVLWADGRLLLPTSSGGPTVTTSAHRTAYLPPSARNVPLVGGTAPFLTDPSKIQGDLQLDSHDDGGRPNRFVDALRTTVSGYANAPRVARLVAMVDDRYVVIADELTASSAQDLALPFHGRGTRSLPTAPGLLAAHWDYAGASLDLLSNTTPAMTIAPTSSSFAPSWGVEEAISGIELRTRASTARALTILHPPHGATVTAIGAGLRVAFENLQDDLVPAGTTGDLETDAALAIVRRSEGRVLAYAILGGTRLVVAGQDAVRSSEKLSLSATLGADGLVAEAAPATARPASFALGFVPSGGANAYANGTALPPSRVDTTGTTWQVNDLAAPATLRFEPNHAPILEPLADATLQESVPFTLTLHASDPDGTPLRFDATGAPDATLDQATGTFTWTPSYDLATRTAPALVPVTFTVTDGAATATRTATFTITNRNRAPTVPDASGVTVRRLEPIELPLGASDPDGDSLTYAIDPAGPTIDATGLLRWTPGADTPIGRASFTVTASDGETTSSGTLGLDVRAANRAPVIAQIGFKSPGDPIVVAAKPVVILDVAVSDPDGDAFTCALTGSAALTWQPSPPQVRWTSPAGHVTATLTCTDALGASGTGALVLSVSDPDSIPETGGCGCRETPAAALALLGLMLLRRRR